jgi:uncharacterized protein involved in exopolysaccharide biosynthesis
MTEQRTERDSRAVPIGSSVDGGEDLSLAELLPVLLRAKRLIIAAGALGFLLGAASGLFGTRLYSSGATFIPQAPGADAAGGGSLALAASQFGIRIPTSGAGWGVPIYIEVIYSRSLLAPIALDTLSVAEEGGQRRAVADLLEVHGPDGPKRLEMTVRALRNVISASENKKVGAVQVTVTTKWPSVSYALAERVLADVNRFNLQQRQSQAGHERRFAEQKALEAERTLEEAEARMRQFLEQNRVLGSPGLTYKRERLQREITIRQQIFLSLLQSVSEARIREVRDTPVITLLESPTVPAIGVSSRTVVKSVGGAFVLGLLMTAFALVQHARSTSLGGVGFLLHLLGSRAPRGDA